MRKANEPFEVVELCDGAKLPALNEVERLVVMGGPMNVYEEEGYPFLKNETEFIARALECRIPTLGICLGAQLIAKALGAKVYKAAVKETGWGDIQLNKEALRDPIFSEMNFPVTRVLQWHEDTFDLPKGSVLLASSLQVPNQAFRVNNSYGLQFHIEVDREMLCDWFGKMPESKNILAEFDRYEPELKVICDNIYKKFFTPKNTGCVGEGKL